MRFPMDHEHRYEITTTWTGNRGAGTKDYRAYARDHEIRGQECAGGRLVR
jgi:hypothetical protein